MSDEENQHAQNSSPEIVPDDSTQHALASRRTLVHDNGLRLTPSRHQLSLVVLVIACLGLLAFLALNGRVRAVTLAPSFAPAQSSDMNFSKFLHGSEHHAAIQCASCHKRAADNSPKPNFPGHKACTSCHLAQFVSTNSSSNQMCAICHTNLNDPRPPMKDFPKLASFNAQFDHAQHMQGAARAQSGCSACHLPLRRSNAALSIPAGLGAHAQCYTCHTPNASSNGRDIASCSTCHEQGRLVRASTNARAFAASFSHAEHGARQRLNCADCHRARSNVPQLQQVTAPRAAQHFANSRAQSCLTCHNGRRAFGDADFNDCRKCHKGQSFQMPR